jgi:hypothetical protein
MAGGGVAAASTYGQSDRHGAYPIADAVTPGDMAATILWRFGIDWRHEIRDPLGRPMPLAEGSPIKALFSCAVMRRAFSAGAIPARQLSFQPVAIGAAMEVTISSEPSMQKGRLATQRVDRP